MSSDPPKVTRAHRSWDSKFPLQWPLPPGEGASSPNWFNIPHPGESHSQDTLRTFLWGNSESLGLASPCSCCVALHSHVEINALCYVFSLGGGEAGGDKA